MSLSNPSPVIYEKVERKYVEYDTDLPVDPCDIYNIISNIKDPEHPYTLEQLKVVCEDQISVKFFHENKTPHIRIIFTPTVPHCSLATTIGLCIREKLRTSEILPARTKLDIIVTEGSHTTEKEINKQINDKERVAAALENEDLRILINSLIREPDY